MWRRAVHWKMKELLGEGSQGCVFKALRVDRETQLTQTVALKILHSKTAVELWRKEFESLHRVRSPYCVSVLAFERMRGRPTLVLEFIDGVSLHELTCTGLASEDEIVEILAQIQTGLVDLESQSTSHGDLSPHNVMVDREGRIRLLDFGLANGSEGQTRMTIEFAAPERLQGSSADFHSDLFSLGRVEQFLRGTCLTSLTSGCEYLQLKPLDRRLRDISPDCQRQRKLAQTVGQILERKRRSQRFRTCAQTPLRAVTHLKTYLNSKITYLLSASVILLGLATSRASQVHQTSHQTANQTANLTAMGSLAIRTHAWHRVLIDGKPMGYAPLTLFLESDRPHRLQWISARHSGQKELRLRPNQQLVLTDRDFSH